MEVKATLKYGKIGQLKACEVANLIRGRNVNEAFDILTYSSKKASRLIKGLLESAIANAEQKKVIDTNNLYVKSICVQQGPHLKRYRPSARSTSFPYKKKQSHIDLVLDER